MSPADLLTQAHAAARRAYVPYSRFPVGAALELPDGRIVPGANVENASYGLTICAERTAVSRMVMEADDPRIVRVAVVGTEARPCFPCGACRQVLHEFGCGEVVVEHDDGSPWVVPFTEILPHGFGPTDLRARPTVAHSPSGEED